MTLSISIAAFALQILLAVPAAVGAPPMVAGKTSLRQLFLQVQRLPNGQVLLAVDTVPVTGNATVPPETSPEFVSALAAHYGLSAVSLGSVAALAPPQIMRLRTPAKVPNLAAGMTTPEQTKYLASTLTPEQWAKLSSPAGLGQADLTAIQRPIFLSLLPDPFTIRRRGTAEHKVLTEVERSQIHLRLQLSTTLRFAQKDNAQIQSTPSTIDISGDVANVATLVLPRRDGTLSAYGEPIKEKIPNSLKKSDLDFSSSVLSSQIPVSGAVTVGALVRHIGETSGLELYADPRLAKTSLVTTGGKAAAGDLLRATCLTLGAAFRAVGSAYILTDDLEGLGSKRAKIYEWLSQADRDKASLLASAEAAFRSRTPLESVDIAADDPLRPGPEMLRSLKKGWQSGDLTDPLVDYTALTPALRSVVDQEAKRRDESNSAAIDKDHVWLGLELALAYDVPGVGSVRDPFGNLGGLQSYLNGPANFASASQGEEGSPVSNDTSLPSSLNQKIVLVNLEAANLDPIIAQASLLQLTEMWIAVPDAASVPEAVLRRTITAATRAGLVVRFGLSVFSSSSTADDASRGEDVNIMGETLSAYSNRVGWKRGAMAPLAYLVPDEVFRARAASEAARLAKLPGVSGIVLSDTVPPGYQKNSLKDLIMGRGDSLNLSNLALGYGAAMRLGFVRTRSIDPIDIPHDYPSDPTSSYERLNLELGHFRTTDAIPFGASDWDGYRHKVNGQAVQEIVAAVHAVLPDSPVFVRNYVNIASTQGQWSSIASVGLLRWEVFPDPTLPASAVDRKSQLPLMDIPVYPGDLSLRGAAATRRKSAAVLSAKIHSGVEQAVPERNGYVIDLTHLTLAQSTSLLAQLVSSTSGRRLDK
ncbi:MAG: hypothetical protein V4671_09515 [Armatimonadota bacterium]